MEMGVVLWWWRPLANAKIEDLPKGLIGVYVYYGVQSRTSTSLGVQVLSADTCYMWTCVIMHKMAGGNVRNHVLLEYEITVPLRARYGRTASSWRRHRTVLTLMLCRV